MHIDFKQVFDDFAKAQVKTWKHPRDESVGASEVFGCLRKAFFDKLGEKLGFEKDPTNAKESWGATMRGTIMENHFVVPALAHLPPELSLMYAGEAEQTTLKAGRSSATPDGLIVGVPKGLLTISDGKREHRIEVTDGCIGLEIKTVDPRVNLSQEKERHRGQAIMGMGLIRETTELVPNHWIIIYVNASWYDDINVFVIPFDNTVYTVGKERAEATFKANGPDSLPAEGRLTGECEHCQWLQACGTASAGAVPPSKNALDNETERLLEERAALYTKLSNEIAALEQQKDAVKVDIKEALKKANTKSFRSELYSVSWSAQKGRKSLNLEKLTAQLGDLTAYYTEGPPFDRLDITEKS